MKEPVRIFSDLHLGHKLSRIDRVAALRPLIHGAGTVVFNGDTWQELAKPFRERSAKMLDALKALCVHEGVDAIFLSGNHDPSWPGSGWLNLAEERIVITHGDGLLYASSPWKREVLRKAERVDALWAEYPAAAHDAEERLRLARHIAREIYSVEYPSGRSWIQRAWDAVVPPKRALLMLQAWWTQGEMGAEFCQRYFPKAEILVMGHFHWAGCWQRMGRRTINTGSFIIPSRACWVEWSEGWLRYGRIDESADACQLGDVLAVWRLESKNG